MMQTQINGLGYDEDFRLDMDAAPSTNGESTDPLCLTLSVEKTTLRHDKAHNVWASFKIGARSGLLAHERIPTDFVLVLDTSDHMASTNKLASACDTVQQLLSSLNEKDRVAIVVFAETASVVLQLDYVTASHRGAVCDVLRALCAAGPANLGDGIFTALSVAAQREEKPPVSQILLLTNGTTDCGMSLHAIKQKLEQEKIDENLAIHCFGYGKDHAPASLQSIAFRTPGGMYYYIEGRTEAAAILSECLAGTFVTVAHTVHVYLEAFDGCRFVKIRTKAPFKAVKDMKQYYGSLGCIYDGEARSFLLRLSLRGMARGRQRIFRVSVSYTSALDRQRHCIKQTVHVDRCPELSAAPINEEVDRQINRVISADAIDKAITAAEERNFGNAAQIIQYAIETISASATSSSAYCKDLIADLRDCGRCVSNPTEFAGSGAHEACRFSTMYNQERSVGLKGLKSNRSETYGYMNSRGSLMNLGQEAGAEVNMRLLPGYY